MPRSARAYVLFLCAVCNGGSALAAETVTLQQALALAQRSSPERLNIATAHARVRLLESLTKRRFELRPQLGFLTLTQPLITAASIGSGLFVNNGWSPSRANLLDARADLLAAELAYRRTRIYKQLQASRAFSELLQAQQSKEEICAQWQSEDRRQNDVDKLLARGRLTLVDQVRYAQEILDRQSECIDAERRRKLASVGLAALIRTSGDLTAVPPSRELAANRQVVYVPEPDDSTLFHSAEPARIRLEIENMRRLPIKGGLRLPDFSFFQSNFKETSGDPMGITKNYLSGGNFLHPTISWKVSLRDTGEHAAEAGMLKAKLDKLEADLDDLEQFVRGELGILQVLEQSASERISVAEKKVELASRSKGIIELRFQKGLAHITDVIVAEQQERRVRSNLARLRYEHDAGRFTLLVLTGNDTPETLQAMRVSNREE